MVKQSVDVCEKKGVLGSGYIPKLHWTDAQRQLRRAVRLLPLRRSELHPHLPHAGRHRIGLGRHHRAEGHLEDRRRGAHRDRRRQGDEVAQAEGARARQLHGDSRAAAGGALPVADDVRAQRARGRRRAQLHERQGARRDASSARRSSATTSRSAATSATTILRQTPVGPDGLAARPITWVEKGVVKNLFYDRYWAKKQNKPFTPTSPSQSLVMDGGDATVEQMIKSTKRGLLVTLLLVHPAGRSDDAAQHRHDARRPVPDRERRDRRAGAELPLERRPGARLQQHLDARPRRCRCTSARPTTTPAPRSCRR